MDIVGTIRTKYEHLEKLFDERTRRIWAATEARAIGRGGLARVAEATGMSRTTILVGMRELDDPEHAGSLGPGRVRRPGGGRKPISVTDPRIKEDLEKLVEGATRGDPESSLRWTTKSTYRLSEELDHRIGPRKVAQLLKEMGYRLQANRKTQEGKSHPDRNEQFENINNTTKRFQRKGEPTISVDTKKKS